jgi:hypothetical protein
MAGLNVAAASFVGFDLDDVGPDIVVGPQGFDGDPITFRCLGMMGSGVVLFENRMMNDGCRHVSERVRAADGGIKPGVKRSGTPGRISIKRD